MWFGNIGDCWRAALDLDLGNIYYILGTVSFIWSSCNHYNRFIYIVVNLEYQRVGRLELMKAYPYVNATATTY
jgi:hypothetical protein